jgi:tetratricopeptide (TPR) repeat protein
VILAVAGLFILVGLLSLSRQTLAEHYRVRAQQQLDANSPLGALTLANRSIRIDGDAVSAYYLKWSALVKLGRTTAARTALDDALRREPDNFVTWALVGDFESNARHPRRALAAYQRASALNPRDVGLAILAVPGD